jgi:glycosyltransferase involved in cell wall biosynthesis
MNVLHINQSDIQGGASIAGYRLHQGLLALGVSSRMLVGYPQTEDDRVAAVPRRLLLENIIERLTKRLGLNYVHFINTNQIASHPFYHTANILNFHNLHSGYFSYLAIAALTSHKPAIWTLHDMWSFTGHCAYSDGCDRWKIGCGHCPYPEAYPQIYRDGTRLEWRLKHWTYQRSNLTIVTPSRWLFDQVQQSMLNQFAVHHIPYGIDTEIYQPLDRQQCRAKFKIPDNHRVLLFAAADFKDPRKGGDLLIQALQHLPNQEITVLILGECDRSITHSISLPVIQLGYVSDDREKAIAYNAADLVVFPTRADNLPLVLQESLACGTPIVSFRIGGVPDLVRPDQTGYLAEPENAIDLKDGIVQLLENPALRDRMREYCRKIAVTEYALELQAKRYSDLYYQVLQQARRS